MNADENEIFEFLKTRGTAYVSATDISRCLGRGQQFQKNRNWAQPILRRMEVDGILEVNAYCEYRIKGAEAQAETTDFKEALHTPGVSLGDTTIIRLGDS